jgi:hypothetical protein
MRIPLLFVAISVTSLARGVAAQTQGSEEDNSPFALTPVAPGYGVASMERPQTQRVGQAPA